MKTIDELGISTAPWHSYDATDSVCVDDRNSRIVHHSGIGFERGIANARLIAAAPNLYEALMKLIVVARNRLQSQPTLDEIEVLTMAESALAKASGEEAK